ncbi:sugar transporter [Sulfitobacter sp. PS-8MA]|uniref:sugar transporter n=1 Tax=Sulfitobacter sp. PS-8MA TaxID=3237707 RepID=UPI0034C5C11A
MPGPQPGKPVLEERVLKKGEQPPPAVSKDGVPLEPTPEPAAPAQMKRRHWGQVVSFILLVILPVAVTGFYLFAIAKDQYASTTGFSVQREEGATASDFLGIIPGLGGGSGASDTDILYEFIQSQRLVDLVDQKLDLRAHYSRYWDGDLLTADKVFSLWPDADAEDLLWFWKRIVRISYDQGSGLIEVQVLAFDPDYAQAIATEIVAQSQIMINRLSDTARRDATRYALDDLQQSLDRLKEAREALTDFRTRTQIVDPAADLQSRLGVMSNLQQQLAQAFIDFDLLLGASSPDDPRVAQARRRIAVIQERIASERESFASDDATNGQINEDYPNLIAEFERLTVDREYAEEAYRAALTALDVARASAARQSRYLATYIDPTRAESSQYPQRFIILGLTALFLVMAWSIFALIYYSIRDRR